ncbi:MAG: 3-isopropylmalate dehydrogenase [Candidatus Dadabacteria bacterium]|nr:3-isopropylmalate dehydrogenase [Candidatus Dadabacteria bacterium]
MPEILVIPGDGIGVEVTEVSLSVLKAVGEKSGIEFSLERALLGGCCIDTHGVPVTEETMEKAKKSDAVLLGAVGGPKWENLEHSLKPERGLLELRKRLDTFANLRPAIVYAALADASTLKREVVEGVDIMVVRELTGGIYFGQPRGAEQLGEEECKAFNTLSYTTSEIERVAKMAFEIARKRRNKVTSIDKSNVLESMVLWRDTVTELHDRHFSDVTLEHLYVDNAAMQLIRRPADFDVMLAGNMFGDIISDEAAQLTGSLGMLPSASVGNKGAIYEPVHGSAPDIAGRGVANPIASILSMAMMLRYSFDMDGAAAQVEEAVRKVLDNGYRTSDIYEEGKTRVGTEEMGSLILGEL